MAKAGRHVHIAVFCILLSLPTSLSDSNSLAKDLKTNGFRGAIHTPGSKQFHSLRKIRNGACDRIVPLLIARPRSTQDVAVAVKVSRMYQKPISVRSGGHSFTCTSLKHGSLHLDLRKLNKVKLVPSAKVIYSTPQLPWLL